MTSFFHDQADGLRGLMAFHTNSAARVMTIAGGLKGVGKTTLTVNLASALAEKGKRVLLIDENPCPNNIPQRLGLKARFDLIHAIYRDRRLDQVVLQGPQNIFVLSALRGIHALSKLDAVEQGNLIKSFRQFSESIDVILVDTAMGGETHVLPLSLASEQVIIVVSGSASSLTGAYALIKILSQEYAKKHFLIFVNKTETVHDSHAVFDNFSHVVSQYLSASLEFAGYALMDEYICQANRLGQPVLGAYPKNQAAHFFRQLADNVVFSPCVDRFKGEIDCFMQRLIQTSHLSMTHFTV